MEYCNAVAIPTRIYLFILLYVCILSSKSLPYSDMRYPKYLKSVPCFFIHFTQKLHHPRFKNAVTHIISELHNEYHVCACSDFKISHGYHVTVGDVSEPVTFIGGVVHLCFKMCPCHTWYVSECRWCFVSCWVCRNQFQEKQLVGTFAQHLPQSL